MQPKVLSIYLDTNQLKRGLYRLTSAALCMCVSTHMRLYGAVSSDDSGQNASIRGKEISLSFFLFNFFVNVSRPLQEFFFSLNSFITCNSCRSQIRSKIPNFTKRHA